MAVRTVGGLCEMTASLGVSCETVAVQQGREHRSLGRSGVGNRYQATIGEDKAD
jgi:hypothetical protein